MEQKISRLVGSERSPSRNFEAVKVRTDKLDARRQKHDERIAKIEFEIKVLEQRILEKKNKISTLGYKHRNNFHTPSDVNYFKYMVKYNATDIRLIKRIKSHNDAFGDTYIVELKVKGEWMYIKCSWDDHDFEELCPSSTLDFLDFDEED